MLTRDLRVLPLLNKSAWVVFATVDGALTAQLVSPKGVATMSESIGTSEGGWDATLDGDGTPWVVTVSAASGCIAVRRAAVEKWGPSLQVSAGKGSTPLIRADEFNNVWIFWKADSTDGEVECRACRMGPRSGQEMVAATFHRECQILDAGNRGGVIWLVAGDSESERWIICGTEHDGFQPPVQLGNSA